MDHAYFIAALVFGFVCFVCYVVGRFRNLDEWQDEFNRLYVAKHKACVEAEQLRQENWSLRQALGRRKPCDICGCPSRLETHFNGRVIRLCDECFHEDMAFLEVSDD